MKVKRKNFLLIKYILLIYYYCYYYCSDILKRHHDYLVYKIRNSKLQFNFNKKKRILQKQFFCIKIICFKVYIRIYTTDRLKINTSIYMIHLY